jgi:hypothetical protein
MGQFSMEIYIPPGSVLSGNQQSGDPILQICRKASSGDYVHRACDVPEMSVQRRLDRHFHFKVEAPVPDNAF